jgi:hypothetical protein
VELICPYIEQSDYICSKTYEQGDQREANSPLLL